MTAWAGTHDRLYGCDRNSLMLDISAMDVKVCQLKTDIFHNDSTSITFKGRYKNQAKDSVRLRHGHNKDFRPDRLQLVYGLNITEDGNVPLTFQLSNAIRPTTEPIFLIGCDCGKCWARLILSTLSTADYATKTTFKILIKTADALLPLCPKID